MIIVVTTVSSSSKVKCKWANLIPRTQRSCHFLSTFSALCQKVKQIGAVDSSGMPLQLFFSNSHLHVESQSPGRVISSKFRGKCLWRIEDLLPGFDYERFNLIKELFGSIVERSGLLHRLIQCIEGVNACTVIDSSKRREERDWGTRHRRR